MSGRLISRAVRDSWKRPVVETRGENWPELVRSSQASVCVADTFSTCWNRSHYQGTGSVANLVSGTGGISRAPGSISEGEVRTAKWIVAGALGVLLLAGSYTFTYGQGNGRGKGHNKHGDDDQGEYYKNACGSGCDGDRQVWTASQSTKGDRTATTYR